MTDLNVLRDISIVIAGFLTIGVLIIWAVMGFTIYRDVRAIVSSVKVTVKKTRSFAAENKADPLYRAGTLLKTLGSGAAELVKAMQKERT